MNTEDEYGCPSDQTVESAGERERWEGVDEENWWEISKGNGRIV